jgi:D-beta-D-heptose 7-phosphate kinase / D-beta-D-heptose 1-phosphate adenosyltransferase
VADYGRGVAAEPGVRAALAGLPRRRPLVWDPHPRGPAPVPGARLATPNRAEAAGFAPEVEGDGLAAVTAQARLLAERWAAAGVAVTLGPGGALLVEGAGAPMVMPATPAPGGDPCGAGDRFAATAAGLLADGALPSEAVAGAVAAASAFVAAGGATIIRLDPASVELDPAGVGAAHPHPPAPAPPAGERSPSPDPDLPADSDLPPERRSPMERALAVIAAVRAGGGTVVATGGCFDLLHAGHVATLRSARALGDCLVVCLNSDDSVRRLKGVERPLVPEADRVAVLEALGCVDAVVPFDERTPEAVLQRLRPDVFAKGGDYALADLPEAALLATWGGQAVVLPYLEGRSTTQLMKEVVRRDSH